MSEWPFPGDSPVVRARKIAWAYRAALLEADPAAVGELDERFRSWGERWPAPVQTYTADEWVSAKEAANILGVAPGTISALRIRGRIAGHLDGKRFVYQVRDIYKLSEQVRRRHKPSTDRVTANGSSVSDDQ